MENVNYKNICTSLECCGHNECSKCFYSGSSDCIIKLMEDAGKVFEKQNAEIERLQNDIKTRIGLCQKALALFEEIKKDVVNEIQTAKSEAIKEFAERLKEKFPNDWLSVSVWILKGDINNLVKEMVGDDNA